MNKLLLYAFTFGLVYVLNFFYVEPSMEKHKKVEKKQIEQPSKNTGYIPELIPEHHNGQ